MMTGLALVLLLLGFVMLLAGLLLMLACHSSFILLAVAGGALMGIGAGINGSQEQEARQAVVREFADQGLGSAQIITWDWGIKTGTATVMPPQGGQTITLRFWRDTTGAWLIGCTPDLPFQGYPDRLEQFKKLAHC